MITPDAQLLVGSSHDLVGLPLKASTRDTLEGSGLLSFSRLAALLGARMMHVGVLSVVS